MTKDTGGPAFPSPKFAVPADADERTFLAINNAFGMTLRDYFAAAALSGYKARSLDFSQAAIAQWAYEDADAMLAERAK